MTREQWVYILENIFSFEKDPFIGRAIFVLLIVIGWVALGVYVTKPDKKDDDDD